MVKRFLCVSCWRPARRRGSNLLCRKHYRRNEPTYTALYERVRRAVEEYEGRTLTEAGGNMLTSDVLYVFEDYVDG